MNHVLCKRGSAIEVIYVDKEGVTVAVISRPTVAYNGKEGNISIFSLGMTEDDGEFEVYGCVKVVDGGIQSMHFDRQITDFSIYKTLINEKLCELGEKQVSPSIGRTINKSGKSNNTGRGCIIL